MPPGRDSGAAARATAATGVHAHSSRSHALLTLSVEHRWRVGGAGGGGGDDGGAAKYEARCARLSLVDLAGSETMARAHGGAAEAAGVATNLGLLTLGQ